MKTTFKRLTQKTLIAGLTSAILSSAALAADTYQIDPRHTFPVFEVNHLGFSTQRGRFNQTRGSIVLDTAAKKGSVRLSIDAASLDMGLADWNKHLLSEDFFNASQFPEITFSSEQLVFTGEQLTAAHGTLTLLGISKPVTLAISNFRLGKHPMTKKDMGGANIRATIKRSDFGMTKYLPAVSDEISIVVPVEAYRE